MAYKAIGFVAALILYTLPLNAQRASIRIDVDRHLLSLDESLVVQVKIEVSGASSYQGYTPPKAKNFDLSAGGLSSQNVSIINGSVRRQEMFSYSAMPKKEGDFQIGPAAIKVGNRWVQSNTIKVKVKGGKKPAPSVQLNGPNSDQIRPSDGQSELPPVFIIARPNKTKVYLGEQILVDFYLYTQQRILGYTPRDQPTTDHFWTEDLDSPRRLELERAMANNDYYQRALLSKRALFPRKAGKLKIGSLSADIRTFDSFRSSRHYASEPVEITVLELPKENQPKDFPEFNVGQYGIAAIIDQKEIKVGEAFTFKLVIRGVGNVDQLILPKFPKLENLKIYQPKAHSKLNRRNRVEGEKIVEYLLMPKKPGELKIPSIELPFFDPDGKTYHIAKTDSITLKVVGSQIKGGVLSDDGSKNILSVDIRPPVAAKKLVHREKDMSFGAWVYWVLVFPFFLFLGVVLFDRFRMSWGQETEKSLSKAMMKKINEGLKAAKSYEKKGDAVQFYAELSSALMTEIDLKFSIKSDGLTRTELRQIMANAALDKKIIDDIFIEFDNCDFARFAPSAAGSGELSAAFLRMKKLLARLKSSSIQYKQSKESEKEQLGLKRKDRYAKGGNA